jgi:Cupin domain
LEAIQCPGRRAGEMTPGRTLWFATESARAHKVTVAWPHRTVSVGESQFLGAQLVLDEERALAQSPHSRSYRTDRERRSSGSGFFPFDARTGPAATVERPFSEGRAFSVSAGKQVDARPGTLVTVPPGTPHTFSNPGEEPVEILCTVTPDLYIAFFRELAQLPPGPPDPAAVGAIMSRYFTDVVRPEGR